MGAALEVSSRTLRRVSQRLVGATSLPEPKEKYRQLAGDSEVALSPAELLAHPAVIATVRDGLARMNAESRGSSMRIQRALLMAEPPQIDAQEITDKGYINQRATLERRKVLVDKLYAGGEGVIEIP